jgi:magnesium chelatase family protein
VLGGNFGINIVGLPDNAVRESRERIQSAIKNAQFPLPTGNARYIINLAPAGIRKEGAALDLPMALSLLGTLGKIDLKRASRYSLIGELALDGRIKPVTGMICMADGALRDGFDGVIVPRENADEAALVQGLDVIALGHLRDACEFLNGRLEVTSHQVDVEALFQQASNTLIDLQDVKGQESAKRALEIVAAGGHNCLLIGSPGIGKTLLLQRLATILPPLTLPEALESTKIHSMAGKLDTAQPFQATRPFHSPHHTISHVALVGGGAYPRPGQVSLAHHGVLFLDELPEFPRLVLEALRQPLEDGVVTIARAQVSIKFPARFILAAAMNPCPCGYLGHHQRACTCSPEGIRRYRGRISGPLMDRIDLHVEMAPVKVDELRGEGRSGEPSAVVRDRVEKARAVQLERYSEQPGIYCNAHLTPKALREFCILDDEAQGMLDRAMEALGLSARAHDRIIRIARTIADLDPEAKTSEVIRASHIGEAVQYRTLDKGL